MFVSSSDTVQNWYPRPELFDKKPLENNDELTESPYPTPNPNNLLGNVIRKLSHT